MTLCQKLMSLLSGARYSRVRKDLFEDVTEDFSEENPVFGGFPMYAIRQKRNFLDGKGSYNVYVIDQDEKCELIQPKKNNV